MQGEEGGEGGKGGMTKAGGQGEWRRDKGAKAMMQRQNEEMVEQKVFPEPGRV